MNTNTTELLRRSRSLLKRIGEEIYNGIALQAMLEGGTLNEECRKRFDHTYGAHGFNIVGDALTYSLIVIVHRLYDPPGQNNASLSELMTTVNDDVFLKCIHAEFKIEISQDEFLSADAKSKKLESRWSFIKDRIGNAATRFSSIRGDQRRTRLKGFRDQAIAHLAEDISRTMSNPPNLDDAFWVLEETAIIVSDLSAVLKVDTFDFEGIKPDWSRCAKSFWNINTKNRSI